MKIFCIIFLLLFTMLGNAQVRVDSSFSFQTNPNKKYSIYIPSSYNSNTPNKLMLGLHPLNVNRWNAISWCDTLTAFAEMNNLILVCPDGGINGKIDDAIDTAFTSTLLDSMIQWYSIDIDKIYVMGFSWGAKTTYTYGLRHANKFGGFLPVGSAMNGTSEVNGQIQNASGKPFYIVHGSNDSPSSRYFPIKDSLINRNAIVNFNLMSGIGHTIDFPNRNSILSTAYQWIDSANCANIITEIINIEAEEFGLLEVIPNIIIKGNSCFAKINAPKSGKYNYEILSTQGQVLFSEMVEVKTGINKIKINTSHLKPGLHMIKFSINNSKTVLKIIIN